MSLTLDRLKHILSYDLDTGIFTYRVTRGARRAGTRAGSADRQGYRRICIDGKEYRENRLAWLYVTGGWPEKGMVDHRDCDVANNVFSNLREATGSQNAANRRPAKKGSGFKGATFHRGVGRWQAQLKTNGKNHYLGLFDTPQAANAAYAAKATAVWNEFARAA